MNGVIASIAVVLFSAMLLFALRNDDMAKCQERFSAEVCYHTLAR